MFHTFAVFSVRSSSLSEERNRSTTPWNLVEWAPGLPMPKILLSSGTLDHCIIT